MSYVPMSYFLVFYILFIKKRVGFRKNFVILQRFSAEVPKGTFLRIMGRLMANHVLASDEKSVNLCVGERTCCAGGVPERDAIAPEKNFWYVAVVRRNNQLVARDQLNRMAQTMDYPLEAYVAAQQQMRTYANRHLRVVEQVVIPGKLFIRIPEEHRIEVLKFCPYISYFVMDPARSNGRGGRDFAKVPQREIDVLRTILQEAEGPVTYSEERPRKGDNIQVLTGQFHGLYGKVYDDSGKTHVIVVLDSLGSFTFRLPVAEVAKV